MRIAKSIKIIVHQGNSQKLRASKLFEIVPDIWLCLDELHLWNHVTSRRYAATADNVDLDHATTVSEKTVACNAAVFPLQYAVFARKNFLGENGVQVLQ